MSAGYSGEGMALIAKTRGLGHLLKTGEWDERVPLFFEVTRSVWRAKRALHPRDYPEKGLFLDSLIPTDAKL
jgi:hypothetical protein